MIQQCCSRCNIAIERKRVSFGVILCEFCENKWMKECIPTLNEAIKKYLNKE